jgi:hypothetical protein
MAVSENRSITKQNKIKPKRNQNSRTRQPHQFRDQHDHHFDKRGNYVLRCHSKFKGRVLQFRCLCTAQPSVRLI